MKRRSKATDLDDAFWRFCAENPHVYDKLLEIARYVRQHGRGRWGIAAIFERLRWISEFETVGDLYKLNNNHRAFYSRLLMCEDDLAGFFETRRSVADRNTEEKAA